MSDGLGAKSPDPKTRTRALRNQAKRKFKKLLKRQGNTCAACGLPMAIELYGVHTGNRNKPIIEHKIPIVLGGDSSIGNLELVHLKCNLDRAEILNGPPKHDKSICRHCGGPKRLKHCRLCGVCRWAFLQLAAGVGIS